MAEDKGKKPSKTSEEQAEEIAESEVFEKLPPQIRRTVEFGMSMMGSSGPLHPQLLSKVKEEHISKILEFD